MKKFTLISATIVSVISITALLNNTVSAQSTQKTNAIPDNVMEIAKKSCVNCHTKPGKKLAMSHVNLLKWNTYSFDEQASKAADMCKMVTKGKMPPKDFRKKNPDFVMTQDEIKTICDWSASIQTTKK